MTNVSLLRFFLETVLLRFVCFEFLSLGLGLESLVRFISRFGCFLDDFGDSFGADDDLESVLLGLPFPRAVVAAAVAVDALFD